MPKLKYKTNKERVEANRVYQREWARKRRQDPTIRAKEAAKYRDRYHSKLKHDPEWVKVNNEANLKRYYSVVIPNPDERQKFREKVRRYQKKRRLRFNQTKIELQIFLGGKCVDCGLTDSRLLDFDHISPITKKFTVSQSLHKGMEELKEEVSKCELRCPNCHRIKTLERNDYDSYKHREYRNKYRTRFKELKS